MWIGGTGVWGRGSVGARERGSMGAWEHGKKNILNLILLRAPTLPNPQSPASTADASALDDLDRPTYHVLIRRHRRSSLALRDDV